MEKAGQPALWYDGKSAAEHEVTVFYRDYAQELRICASSQINDTAPLAVWKTDSVRLLTGKLSGSSQPLTLSLRPDEGQRLIFKEAQAASAASAWLEGAFARRRRKRLRRWLAGTALVWLLFAGLYLSSPVVFSFAARVIPQSWEERLGKSTRESLISMLKRIHAGGTRGVCEQGTNSPDLHHLINRLAQGSPTHGYDFDLVVLDADFVNAFALPGGYMAVSASLIRHCQSPDELAGVIAHEMAHVTARHGTGALLRQFAWEAMLRMIGVHDSTVGSIAQVVMSSSFSRDDERAADMLGVERLVGAGVNPLGMADFFARLDHGGQDGQDGSGLSSYIASHPPLKERRENIRLKAAEYVKELGSEAQPYSPAMDAAAWDRLRALCPAPEKKGQPDKKDKAATGQQADAGPL